MVGEFRGDTYNSVAHDTCNGGSHVDAIADNEVCRYHGHLVVHAAPLPSVLLADHPDVGWLVGEAVVCLCGCLEGVI